MVWALRCSRETTHPPTGAPAMLHDFVNVPDHTWSLSAVSAAYPELGHLTGTTSYRALATRWLSGLSSAIDDKIPPKVAIVAHLSVASTAPTTMPQVAP